MRTNKKTPFHDDARRYGIWFQKNNHLFDSEVQAISELMEKRDKNLEIGIGTGLFAKRLSIGEGVEPTEPMRKIAQARGIKVHNGEAENLPLPDQSYEQVFMITVDCFLKDLSAALEEVHRILVENGILIFAFLDRATPLGALYEEKKASNPFYKNANFHSADEIKAILIKSGFRVEASLQTVFTLENIPQPPKEGLGEGVFAVLKISKSTN